jgi:Protein of unknown function (DUF2946)
MDWFRCRSRLGAYLALVALTFQLAVSFGHVHLDNITPTAALASTLASGQPPSDEANAPSSPASHDDLADRLCPICTLIHLAGATMPAETPPLPLPSIFRGLRLEAAVAFDVTASQSVLFQARAPPIA